MYENVGLEIGYLYGNLLYGKILIFFFVFNKKKNYVVYICFVCLKVCEKIKGFVIFVWFILIF